MLAPEGAAIIGIGVAAGASSAMVTAFSEIATGQAINPGALFASFMLGVTSGWMGAGAAIASGSPLIGGAVTAGLDAFYAAVTNAAQSGAPAGSPQLGLHVPVAYFPNAGVTIYASDVGRSAIVVQNGVVIYSGPNPP
jgi:hypothetical protein